MRLALIPKAAFVVAVGALLVLPSVASAVLSGANGRIAYVSGRGATDAQAKIYLRVAAGSFGLGPNTGPVSLASGQHRHPTWSPDRTKIAYALGDASCATDCDIYVLDLTSPFPLPENVTNTPTVTEDRPAWSPDGTRIAYESEVSAGSGQVDIQVDPVGAGLTLNLTNTAGAGEIEGKPAWTPDSSEIYYHTGDPAVDNSLDIVKEPSGGGTVTKIVANPLVNEFQPSLSPDGQQLCFTRGTGKGFNGTADVIVSLANGGAQKDLSDNVGTEAKHGDFNCTWSPNDVFVAYVRGTFGNGDLVMERADFSEPIPIELETSLNLFDGNPDWAPDGRPVCKDATVDTGFNQPVTIELQCFDSGPFYERTQVQESAPEKTANGTLSAITQGDQEPSTVIYTPNAGFSGKDTFQTNSFDKIAGFGEPKTVTINVAPPPPAPKAPVVSSVKVTPRKAKAGAKLTVRWQLDEAASTKLTFERVVGFRMSKGCRQKPVKPRCYRYGNVGAINVANAKAGANTLSFRKLPNGRKLPPSRYRVSVQARDADNLLSNTSLSPIFQIVPKKG